MAQRERRETQAEPETDQRTPAADGLVGVPSPATAEPSSHARSSQEDESRDRASAVGDEGNAAGDQSGVDERRRGWFWHWNTTVTQYAPLIGLKGVGLLNSYTVWTDRRDESPHRGYAFPSQQAEADFYGEDRSELITINKILIALGLIEIRKEMLQRVDERGRRWRVPHNLYRVKDRPDGLNLTASDVLRVAELARDDAAVYRYVRRVFSQRFKPIDRDNVWREILEELSHHPLWLELQERTRAQEERASARTRAGHKTRSNPRTSGQVATPRAGLTDGQDSQRLFNAVEQSGVERQGRATTVAESNRASEERSTTVADSSNGSDPDVARSNRALRQSGAGSAGRSDNGERGDVGGSNTTYEQITSTTTTTTRDGQVMLVSPVDSAPGGDAIRGGSAADRVDDPHGSKPPGARIEDAAAYLDNVATRTTAPAAAHGNGVQRGSDGRSVEPGHPDTDGREGQVSASASAIRVEGALSVVRSGTTASGPDRQRARGAGAGKAHGERRLAAAESGGPLVDPSPLVVSTFEAANDRPIKPLERELLAELERDADPAARAAGATGAEWVVAAMREAVASGSAFVAPKRVREIVTRWANDAGRQPSSPAPPPQLAPQPAPSVPGSSATVTDPSDVRLPGGARGASIWNAVLSDLSRLFAPDAYDRLLAGSAITRYWRGTVEIRATSPDAAAKLSAEYRSLVERHLNARLRRPVGVRFWADTESEQVTELAEAVEEPQRPADAASPMAVAADDLEIGRQLWQAVLSDLAAGTSTEDLDRLRGGAVLGEDANGLIVLAAGSPHARRLIDGRYGTEIQRSLSALLGRPVTLRTILDNEWRVADEQK